MEIALDSGNKIQILKDGLIGRKNAGSEFKKQIPQVRAVIGGTGDYMGARGQLTTTRNEDGTYEHLIELMD